MFLLCLALAGCRLGPEPPAPRDCDERHAFYPDADGDGLGEPTAVAIACEAPEGYVSDLDTAYDTYDTGGG